jgi:D-glycero-alpha-D-manno-heptose 1-phosphate guanylyltransferase
MISLNNKLIMNAFILCGGFGTRISKVAKNIPKCMLEVKGKPFISHVIDDVQSKIDNKIILCTGYKGDYFDEYRLKKNIFISHENTPLGTGGAILNASPSYYTEKIIILNGDSYCNFNLIKMLEFHSMNLADITILYAEDKERVDAGYIQVDKNSKVKNFNEKNKIYETNKYINAGIYIINNELIKKDDNYQRNKKISLEMELIPKWMKSNKVLGFKANGFVIDIGTPDRLINARSRFEISST